MSFDILIKMDVFHCSKCGSLYGAPDWIASYRRGCPMCVADDLRVKKQEIYDLVNQIRGLRAALTRAKKDSGR